MIAPGIFLQPFPIGDPQRPRGGRRRGKTWGKTGEDLYEVVLGSRDARRDGIRYRGVERHGVLQTGLVGREDLYEVNEPGNGDAPTVMLEKRAQVQRRHVER